MLTLTFSIMMFFAIGSTPVSPDRIKQAVSAYVAARLDAHHEDYQIEFRGLPSAIVASSPAYAVQIGISSVPVLKGLVGIPVEIVCNGRVEQRVVVSARIRTFARALVVSRQLQRHEIISADATTAQRVETTGQADDFIPDGAQIIGMRTVRMISVNAVLCRSMVERTPVVKQDDAVTIAVRSGKTTVTVQGVAKQEGCIGDVITVQRPGLVDRFKATVIDARTVLVDAGGVLPGEREQ
jgi:flagella basal body P-ring formation protein FlgA